MTSIWWIHRDLRLTDNPTLHAALEAGEGVPVFILDPRFDSASLESAMRIFAPIIGNVP